MSTEPQKSALIVGDIHHRVDLADRAIKRFGDEVDRIVFLGDYFDEFGDSPLEMRRTVLWFKESLKDPRRIHLIGNHDFPYMFQGHQGAGCPGWTVAKQRIFDEEFGGAAPEEIRMALQIGPWLLSHAGISLEDLDRWGQLGLARRLDGELGKIRRGENSLTLARSSERGGHDKAGSILWQDWAREFRPLPGVNQIVGHTPAKGVARSKYLSASGGHRTFEIARENLGLLSIPQPGPRWASCNWCLDTKLELVGVIENGNLRIEPL